LDKKILGNLLTVSLTKYNFENYGSKLFYLELKDSIIILEQTVYNGGAEIYLRIIIKECHPEISKITKNVIKDKLLIDTHTCNKLYYKTSDGYHWDFFEIDEEDFENTIDEFYKENIKPFETGYLNGIKHYNDLFYDKIFYGQPIKLYKDSAQKIKHPELASHIGHEWFLSDYYYLVYRCNIDSRFVNSNTEKYIIENVIEQSPEELKGKDLTKWRNERCKEIFVAKRMWRRFGYGITFPFIDGKPLKFFDTDIQNGKAIQVYKNEDTGEMYHCRITDKSDPNDVKYELYKA
jgi:hypothetical protein